MNLHGLALQLMACQGVMGAFDTLYHHELTEALPQRPSARRELTLHAVRALIYGALFAGLSCWIWQGPWALLLLMLLGVEVVLTLWDFVIEDQTRLLPATERVTHTLLAINGGAFCCLLLLQLPAWWQAPAGLAYAPHGWLSVFLFLCGVGVALSGVRDGLAAYRIGRASAAAPLAFGGPAQQVLVTGATGFIGRRLVASLLASGHQVWVLTRSPNKAAWEFDGAVRCLASMDDLAPSQRIDVVINLAGARILGRRWTLGRKAELRRSRVALTAGLVRWIAAAHSKPRLLVSASAIGYYGLQDQASPQALNEASAPQAIFMSQLCQEWEAAAAAARQHGVPVALLRFGVVLGAGGALPMMLLPVWLGMAGRMGTGRQRMSWIHLDDALAALAFVWQHPHADGAWNLTAPDCPTQQEFLRTAARIAGRPYWLPTPAWPVRLLLGEQADLLLEGQRVVPARLLASGFHFRYPAMQDALHQLL